MMFFLSMITGTLISISSLSWMGMWMGLEINLLSIIPLMNSNKNSYSSEASLKYFITQALASTIILFSMMILLNDIPLVNLANKSIIMMFNSAILTKMGAAPFHFWFPEIMEGLNWNLCLIMLTWQKITPMVILMYNSNLPLFFMIIIIFSMLISGIIGFNQTSMRKILAYSSINHIAWMISTMFIMETTWFYYFIVYVAISINITLIFNLLNVFQIKQMITVMNKNPQVKFFFILNFLSLGGLPPFLGFFPKWLTIQNLIENNFFIMTFIMIILTLLTLVYYIRLMYSTILLSSSEMNFILYPKLNQFWIFSSNFVILVSLLTCTILFNYL
uniref:NADH dehydrogenase subunit 2 n=1 Tax=Hesperus amabilis TaxID=1912673 RepID=UPI002798EB0C|nr:NADH dehydrogenase subunit 2 [Hesperus amabilis]WGO76428.1 NADH dehydrogenase subunit 2 [Hesperus amabilis]